MELRVRIDPAHLDRFKGQAILKTCRQGKPLIGTEDGALFDTPGGDLYRRGIALAVARHGSRFWQTVSQTLSPIDRREESTARDSFAPDWPEASLPPDSLQPVFTYRCRRSIHRLGGPDWAAEMIIERGESAIGATSLPFCLITFRLTDGGSAPLAAVLQALAARVPLTLDVGDRWAPEFRALHREAATPFKSKVPPLTPGHSNAAALRSIARSSLAHILANHRCLIETGAPGAIHQMRVGLRRLRSALSLFKAMLGDPQSQNLRIELRWIQQVLGAARDADITQSEILAPLATLYQTEPGYQRLVAEIEAGRQARRAESLAHLATPRFAQALLLLAFWIEEAGRGHALADQPLRKLALSTLNRRYRHVFKQMSCFQDLDTEHRHQCRIEIKKLRYAVDFMVSLIADPRAATLVSLLASMQDSLGGLNDVATARGLIQEITARSPDPALIWTAGLVIGWHQHRCGELTANALKDWRAIERIGPFWSA